VSQSSRSVWLLFETRWRCLSPVYTIQPVVRLFDNQLFRVYKRLTGCQTRLTFRSTGRFDNRFDNRLDVCLHDTAGCQTGCRADWQPAVSCKPHVSCKRVITFAPDIIIIDLLYAIIRKITFYRRILVNITFYNDDMPVQILCSHRGLLPLLGFPYPECFNWTIKSSKLIEQIGNTRYRNK